MGHHEKCPSPKNCSDSEAKGENAVYCSDAVKSDRALDFISINQLPE